MDLGGNQTRSKRNRKDEEGLSKTPQLRPHLEPNEEMTSTSSVAMPEIPLGKVLRRKKPEDLDDAVLGHDFGTNPFSKKPELKKTCETI